MSLDDGMLPDNSVVSKAPEKGDLPNLKSRESADGSEDSLIFEGPGKIVGTEVLPIDKEGMPITSSCVLAIGVGGLVLSDFDRRYADFGE